MAQYPNRMGAGCALVELAATSNEGSSFHWMIDGFARDGPTNESTFRST